MLLLCFRLGNDRYAIDCRQVIEVVPLLAVKRIPHAPAAIAGAFNYRGAPVPAIDLGEFAWGRPSRQRLSTRIIVVDYPDADGALHALGLVAEGVSGTVRRELTEFRDAGVTNGDTPYLGPVAAVADGLLQWIDVRQLLPTSVRDLLFCPAPAPQ